MKFLSKYPTPIKIIIALSVVALGLVGYYIINVLDTFTPTQDSASLPVELEYDDTVQPTETIEDEDTSQPATWADSLTDVGNNKLQDANGNVFYIDADGNIIDDAGSIFDDTTGEVINAN
jgi:hypothetical protein